MNQKQMNRLEMFKTVQSYLDNNTAIWSTIPVLVTQKNQFDEMLLSISDSADKQENSRIFLGRDKTTQKRLVSQKTDILNDALEAYASITENKVLLQKASKTFSDLNKLRNQEFEVVIKETITLLGEYLPQLVDYGVSDGQLIDLQNTMDTYLVLTGQPRQYRIAQKQATTSLSDLFDLALDVLSSKIDKLMTSYKRTDVNFYNGYQSARLIIGD